MKQLSPCNAASYFVVCFFLIYNFFLNNLQLLPQARRKIVEILKDIIDRRRNSQCSQIDMLDLILKSDDSMKSKLTDEQIIDLIIALIYSGYETVSTTTMMAVKFLHDHPKALQELRVRMLAEFKF